MQRKLHGIVDSARSKRCCKLAFTATAILIGARLFLYAPSKSKMMLASKTEVFEEPLPLDLDSCEALPVDEDSPMSEYRNLSADENCSASPEDSIDHIVGKPLDRQFKTCALVGGAHSLLDEMQGKLVDDHEAVIRVNRLPRGRYRKFIGSRTTVYLAGARADGIERFVKEGYWAKFTSKTGKSVMCSYDNSDCRFEYLVMNFGTLKRGVQWNHTFPMWNPGWQPETSPSFGISHLSMPVLNAIRLAEPHAIGIDHGRVTSGIQAIFMAATLCDTIDIYGMASNGTLDNHFMSAAHSLNQERRFMLRLAAGDDFGPLSCNNCTDGLGDCNTLNRLLCTITRKAREGKFIIHRPKPVEDDRVETTTPSR